MDDTGGFGYDTGPDSHWPDPPFRLPAASLSLMRRSRSPSFRRSYPRVSATASRFSSVMRARRSAVRARSASPSRPVAFRVIPGTTLAVRRGVTHAFPAYAPPLAVRSLMKYTDSANNFEVAGNNAGAIDLMQYVTAGTGPSQLEGNRLVFDRIQLRIQISRVPTTQIAPYRFSLVYDKQPVGNLPTYQDVYSIGSGVGQVDFMDFANQSTRDRFDILWEYSSFVVSPGTGVGGEQPPTAAGDDGPAPWGFTTWAGQADSLSSIRLVNVVIPLGRRKSVYEIGAVPGLGSLKTGLLFMLICGWPAAVGTTVTNFAVNLRTRTTFFDA